MAEAQLSVELTAKIDGFRNNLKIAGQDVSNFAIDADGNITSFGKSVNRLEQQLKTFQQGLKNSLDPSRIATLNSAIEITKGKIEATNKVIAGGGGFKSLTTGSNQAANALTNLGRVAQDAPFGFIGIQNNLNPLLESFQRLREETGSGSAALKALGSSLIGPAGLGIALSVISAGVLLYQQYQQKANKTVKEAEDENKNYADTLGAVDRALLKGNQAAESTLIPLKALYEATQNTSLSLVERKKAVDSLQEQYPAYFKNISDETILAGKAEGAYLKLTAAIVAKAKATAIEDEIKDNAKLQRTLDKRAENNKKATEDARKNQAIDFAIASKNAEQLAALRKKNTIKSLSDINPNPDIRNKGENGEIGDLKTLNDLTAEGVGIQNQKNVAKREEVKLSNVLKGIIEANGVDAIIPDKPGSLGNKAKEVKTLADVMKELNIELLQAANNGSGTFGDQQKEKVNDYQKAIDELIKLGYKPAGEAIQKLKAQQQGLFDKDAMGDDLLGKAMPFSLEKLIPSTDPILVKPVLKLQPVITGLTDAEKSMQKLGEDFGKLTQNSIGGALADAGSAIGEALASGNNVIQALGTSLLKSFGGFLSELGRLLISYGAAALLKAQLDLSLAIPGAAIITGPAAIAAGVALEIAGSAIGSFASGKSGNNSGSTYQKPTAFANGGIIYGPTLGLMGEYAGAKSDPEVVAPLSKLKSILGGQNDSGANVTNVNNGSPVILSHEIQMRGRDLWLIVKQEEAKQKRI